MECSYCGSSAIQRDESGLFSCTLCGTIAEGFRQNERDTEDYLFEITGSKIGETGGGQTIRARNYQETLSRGAPPIHETSAYKIDWSKQPAEHEGPSEADYLAAVQIIIRQIIQSHGPYLQSKVVSDWENKARAIWFQLLESHRLSGQPIKSYFADPVLRQLKINPKRIPGLLDPTTSQVSSFAVPAKPSDSVNKFLKIAYVRATQLLNTNKIIFITTNFGANVEPRPPEPSIHRKPKLASSRTRRELPKYLQLNARATMFLSSSKKRKVDVSPWMSWDSLSEISQNPSHVPLNKLLTALRKRAITLRPYLEYLYPEMDPENQGYNQKFEAIVHAMYDHDLLHQTILIELELRSKVNLRDAPRHEDDAPRLDDEEAPVDELPLAIQLLSPTFLLRTVLENEFHSRKDSSRRAFCATLKQLYIKFSQYTSLLTDSFKEQVVQAMSGEDFALTQFSLGKPLDDESWTRASSSRLSSAESPSQIPLPDSIPVVDEQPPVDDNAVGVIDAVLGLSDFQIESQQTPMMKSSIEPKIKPLITIPSRVHMENRRYERQSLAHRWGRLGRRPVGFWQLPFIVSAEGFEGPLPSVEDILEAITLAVKVHEDEIGGGDASTPAIPVPWLCSDPRTLNSKQWMQNRADLVRRAVERCTGEAIHGRVFSLANIPMDTRLIHPLLLVSAQQAGIAISAADICRWGLMLRSSLLLYTKSLLSEVPMWLLRAAFRSRLSPRAKVAAITQRVSTEHSLFLPTMPQKPSSIEKRAEFLRVSVKLNSSSEQIARGLIPRMIAALYLPPHLQKLVVASIQILDAHLKEICGSVASAVCYYEFVAATILACCRLLWPSFRCDTEYQDSEIRQSLPAWRRSSVIWKVLAEVIATERYKPDILKFEYLDTCFTFNSDDSDDQYKALQATSIGLTTTSDWLTMENAIFDDIGQVPLWVDETGILSPKEFRPTKKVDYQNWDPSETLDLFAEFGEQPSLGLETYDESSVSRNSDETFRGGRCSIIPSPLYSPLGHGRQEKGWISIFRGGDSVNFTGFRKHVFELYRWK